MRLLAYATSFALVFGTAIYSVPTVDVGDVMDGEETAVRVPDDHPMQEWVLADVKRTDVPAPEENPITEEKVELGNKLFFDPRLSASNTTSCATCHDPSKGYSDGRTKFEGDHGEVGPRATPTVTNLAWGELFFWDGRASSLEEQALGPIESKMEMRQDLDELARELERAGYQPLFEAAFGTDAKISGETIAKAIATFERTLVSRNAPFDRYMQGNEDAMTPSQVRGMELFQGKAQCADCHSGPQFTDYGFHNIGVDTTDVGRYEHLSLPSMKYAFKTPSLRDVEYRAPYLHDGSEETLRDVVELYNRGGNPGARGQKNLAIEPLDLTEQEIDDLVAFMKALSGEGAHGRGAPGLPSEDELPPDADLPGRKSE